ncbi:DUF3159 domain-containing protein [Helcobacillus massiliensis]|uniref:DUF3159 domain-containing protein n=1 Tax=Helcobacillus massiliensis TaxID=521392 RepID=A0A839QTW8_9MICO|nr:MULTISPECIES: DUF3159 domain-containing protein [Helcobacillus]MBB3022299.1 hypothetical protein [Helcobacillus massiliensis]MCG7426480.1 DUF3159 domain-containing protein [Helcobacillus sp. ACRRO]MCT1556939.1 DUF3159 domain-containing protein [Helcobacillus massiliensis]MCT2035328.1 DUF3159 domain-containing protein [Helcobacillus massiliensis]MCT2331457.1 DUF3159 domain-containing protein [Helcobacillus massiliensis]
MTPDNDRPVSERGSEKGMRAAFTQDDFSVSDAIGGPRGILESVLPTLIFVVLYVITRDVTVPAVAAVTAVIVLLLARLVQRQSVSTVLGGVVAVAASAVLAVRSGDGSDFFLIGIITNAVSCTVLVASVLAGWPLVGVLAGMMDQRIADWREHPSARSVYRRATLVLAGLFAAKVAVQAPLYLTDQVEALGAAKLVMGLPAFALVVFFIYLMHRALLQRLGRAEQPPTDQST